MKCSRGIFLLIPHYPRNEHLFRNKWRPAASRSMRVGVGEGNVDAASASVDYSDDRRVRNETTNDNTLGRLSRANVVLAISPKEQPILFARYRTDFTGQKYQHIEAPDKRLPLLMRLLNKVSINCIDYLRVDDPTWCSQWHWYIITA